MSATYDLFSLRHEAPDRPPHWRWLRAKWLADRNQQPDRRRDDGWVVVAMQYQRHLAAAAGDEVRMDQLADRHPAAFWAHRISLHPSRAVSRDQVEARLLVKDFAYDIASSRTGLNRNQLEAYEKLFFDVRDRRENMSWMTDCVFGQDILKGFNPKQNTGLMLKVGGWLYGNTALDRLSGLVVDGRVGESDEALCEQVDQGEDFEGRFRSYLATRTLPIDPFTAPVIYQHANDLRRRSDDRKKNRDTGDTGPSVGGLREIVFAIGAGLKMVTKNSLTGKDPLTDALNSAAEPRAADLFRLTAGGDGPTVTIANVKFPEVTANDRK